jgi:4-hydroxybenzoate polyprenyltransferase
VSQLPLAIDFEHALLRCDLALESVLRLFREHPWRALVLLVQLVGNRARVVSQLEQDSGLEVSHVPFNPKVIELINAERAKGRHIVLVSAHYRDFAHQVAEHLQLFDRVAKRDDLATELGPSGFDYVGDAPAGRTRLVAWISALRIHQWAKNLLVFVPLLTSHQATRWESLTPVALAFVLFGLCASSVYLLNDLIDVRNDRSHPTKRFRPIASGEISSKAAVTVALPLLIATFFFAWRALPPAFSVVLATYWVTTFAYSIVLKRVMMLDVVVLALLYTLRIIAGTCAFEGNLTFWLLGFSMFIFVSLAFAKRYGELLETRTAGGSGAPRGRGYVTGDLQMIASLGAASGYISVMVLALYIQDPSTAALYRHPQLIWFACPLLLYWIGRTWLLTYRGQMHEDPVVFAITDRVSLLTGAVFGLIFVLAS